MPVPAITILIVWLLGLHVVAFAEQQLLLGGEEGAAALASAAAATTTTSSRAAPAFSAAATDAAATALTTTTSNKNNDDILVLTAAATLGRSRESALVHWQEAILRDADLKFSPHTNQLVYACTGLGIHAPTGLLADAPRLAAALSSSRYINNNTTTTAAALITAVKGDPSSFAFPDELDPSTTDAFRLHSRPGATKKIVLDFTGHTLRSGTWWSKNNPNGVTAPIVAPPWSLDTDRAYSTTELDHIISIWRNVAEDYASWDVDVTTEQPSGTDDQGDEWLVGRGVRVVIGANTGWWLSEAGGLAFVTSFGVKESGPVAFIFNQDPLGVARAVSHEVGHTLGLGHHGNVAHGTVASSEYYAGHRQWAPVMGVGYYTNVVQWSNGDYPYASNPTQDDIKVISSYLPPVSTRQGGGGGGAITATAVALVPPFSPSTPTLVTGLMLASTDLHVFKFRTSAAGRVTLALSVTAPGTYGARTHLAARVRVFSSENAAVIIGTPFDNVGATGIDGNMAETPAYAFDVPTAGLYYVELSATGNGDFANYGYSAYGSSGTFMLTLGCATHGLVVDAGALPPQPPPLPNPPTPPPTSQGDNTDSITCKSPTYTLDTGKCGAAAVAAADVYSLSSGSGSGGAGVTTTLPSSSGGGLLGPGVHRIDVIATNSGAKCRAVVTVQPCRPVVVSKTAGVRVPSQPGSCGGLLSPAQAVSAATLGQGAISINARTSATGPIFRQPLPPGRYYVQVVYPGGIVSAVSARALPVKIIDVEAPVALIKPTVARYGSGGSGFICARGRYSASSTACLSMSTLTGVVMMSDNCPASNLKRRYSCSGAFCPAASTMRPAAARLCVPVVRGGGRRDVVFTLAVTDRGANVGSVQIPVAAYHYDDAPDGAGVTCYYD